MHPQAPRRTTHAYGTPVNRLVYDRWGQFGRPVVLLHGLLYDRTMWWPVAAELGNTCSVLAVDLPGHGESAPRGDYDLSILTSDLAVLINRLDLHRAPVLVGHGESALLAEAFAAEYATKAVLTVDEPPDDLPETVEQHLATADLDAVPEPYRQFAVPRRDVALLHSYRSWFGKKKRDRTVSRAGFPHLSAPVSFATNLRSLI
ncbi:pimeloyl-ACP methyl ester carboxylesterase [Actinoplanes lutulentus]|uniref:Alpha/beta hydrolase family protein n=1 Tax=Actinoplanes lutulentus TaxID=1287878 RepID=A0A327ZM36_9ACTN|nr:alpha/beta hydrolase [Actinoplanes lutulentus]MBB2941202.1 pimeloyl-ACP methyl ester carboxylesterase [Actinoplanes lutulentus]RAK43511.1 alpha/beta hydrolase family protein [Actinoplanes lutulentus]